MTFSPTRDRAPSQVEVLSEPGRSLLFRDARTVRSFDPEPIPESTLDELWELARQAPTAWNSQPLRVVHVVSADAKARLLPLVDPRNRSKVEEAPVTSILAADTDFHDELPVLFPPAPQLKDQLEREGRGAREPIARFNASIQIGCFMLAARAVGLSVGPMVGFDAERTTREFLDAQRSVALLLVNLGLPGPDALPPRLPRRAVADVVSTV